MRVFLSIAFFLITQFSFTSEYKTDDSIFIDSYEEATIHFNDGTSIRGYGKITINSSVKFKISEDSKANIWTELMVKGITLHRQDVDIEFLYVHVKNSSLIKLLEVIELGEISIFVEVNSYLVETGGQFNNTPGFVNMPSYYEDLSYQFFLKKESEKEAIKLFGIFNFKKHAIAFFEDCPQIVDRNKNRKYNRGDIIEMVHYYNDYCAA